MAIVDAGDSLPRGVPVRGLMRLRSTADGPVPRFAKALEFLRCVARLKAFRPELFIAVGYGGSYARFAQLIGKECFRFYHELYLTSSRDGNGSDVVRTAQNKAFDAVAVQSPSMVKGFKAVTPGSMPVRSLPGLRCPVCKHGRRSRFRASGLSGSRSLADWKRTRACAVLQAFHKVREALDAALDIHGDGAERSNIADEIARLELTERVRLCGRYPAGEGYARLMCGYDALILPSIHSEGLPLVLLEAMSYGLPFLSTRIGAIEDASVGNPDAFIVEPQPASLASGLLSLGVRLREGACDPARQRRYYKEHFSPDVMAARWREMLTGPREFFMKEEA